LDNAIEMVEKKLFVRNVYSRKNTVIVRIFHGAAKQEIGIAQLCAAHVTRLVGTLMKALDHTDHLPVRGIEL